VKVGTVYACVAGRHADPKVVPAYLYVSEHGILISTMTPLPHITGQDLIAARQARGLSQVALSRLTGIPAPYLSKIENEDTHRRIAKVLASTPITDH
jgi:hypothetical protein